MLLLLLLLLLYLPLHPHTFPFVISVVRLIEVACVVIFRSKLLQHFDLNFGFLLSKHILIFLLSACKFAMGIQQLLLFGCSDAVKAVYTGDFCCDFAAIVYIAAKSRLKSPLKSPLKSQQKSPV